MISRALDRSKNNAPAIMFWLLKKENVLIDSIKPIINYFDQGCLTRIVLPKTCDKIKNSILRIPSIESLHGAQKWVK